MKNSWKDFFYYSKGDRIALWIIVTIIIAIISGFGGYFISDKIRSGKLSEEEQRYYKDVQAEVEKRRQQIQKKAPYYYQTLEGRTAELFYFDPNVADSTHFLRLGLRPYIVRNIYKYRAKGGVFRRPDDFAKLYGLDRETFERLRPYIRIGGKVAQEDSIRLENGRIRAARRDSVSRLKQEKYETGVVLDLNSVDTTELKKIPGIGSGYAVAIVRYRQQLGGYVSVNQLKEIGVPESTYAWFNLSTKNIKRIKINSYTFAQLNRHPYLNFYQTKAICEHRRKYGPIQDMVQLVLYTAFTQNDLHRIEPYIDFSR